MPTYHEMTPPFCVVYGRVCCNHHNRPGGVQQLLQGPVGKALFVTQVELTSHGVLVTRRWPPAQQQQTTEFRIIEGPRRTGKRPSLDRLFLLERLGQAILTHEQAPSCMIMGARPRQTIWRGRCTIQFVTPRIRSLVYWWQHKAGPDARRSSPQAHRHGFTPLLPRVTSRVLPADYRARWVVLVDSHDVWHAGHDAFILVSQRAAGKLHREEAGCYVRVQACGIDVCGREVPTAGFVPKPTRRLSTGVTHPPRRYATVGFLTRNQPAPWTFYKPLVRFNMRYQCHVLAAPLHDDTASRSRQGVVKRSDYGVGVLSEYCLVVCAVGGTPVGTLAYTEDGDDLYVAALCAVTRSHIGSVLIRHIQDQAASLPCAVKLDAYASAEAFYSTRRSQKKVCVCLCVAHGFEPHGSVLWVWNPPNKKQKTSSSRTQKTHSHE